MNAKRQRCSGRRFTWRNGNKNRHPKPISRRVLLGRRQIVPHFSTKVDVNAAELERIFGTPSIDRAIAILIRLHRMKRVSRTGRAAKEHWAEVVDLIAKGDRWTEVIPGRRFHHLTSNCRWGMPYRGDGPGNLLLLKKQRHLDLHSRFGDRTLEEIILCLMWICGSMYRECRLLRRRYFEATCARRPEERKVFLTYFYQSLPRIRGTQRLG